MTYCVAIRLDSGIVFLADSRTNAGVDHIGTFRKMHVIEQSGDRVLVMMTAGNLAISQAVKQVVLNKTSLEGYDIRSAPSMFDCARLLGEAVRDVYHVDGPSLAKFNIDFNCNIILGGQIRNEPPRLFLIYSAGNFIESCNENLYFQIGEAKYGKPILDRVIRPETSLDEATKCALISMDSTLRSNLSVGMPLDLLCYESNALSVTRFANIDQRNAYMAYIRNTWGMRLKQVFSELDTPNWNALANENNYNNTNALPLLNPAQQNTNQNINQNFNQDADLNNSQQAFQEPQQ
jgi:putative proteasome-type protease